ncbi:Fic family protein [Mycoplasma sp. NEAQ87857]|uniref:Fic family protein n=1 Tax=Mycoplasma sp. NEAQ87857 TaxID=2683967 RepID=UPI00131779A6|nr:Fic/DOC family N-terminal domain-containing protein [Mycoplasma sp. NEAQ87857]QGZ97447.1 Fic family protein [Mycoplasma sp. NEAQ87857]
MNNERAGKWSKQLSGEMTYYSFHPSKLPPKPEIEIDDEMYNKLIHAYKVLAILDDRSSYIPNMDLFISMYVQKEALLSSQIEGTQATLEDIFDSNISQNINLDVDEVINYIKATNYAIQRLQTFPLCNRLLLEVHKILLDNTRGKDKHPGEFRRSQNWIGGVNSTIKTARFIPPDVNYMKQALSDLEIYMNNDDQLDDLIKIALIHYQFETIHPFLDDNGRIGRLLIVLYLLEKKIIKAPSLYMSFYLKQHRIEYYDRMTTIRQTGDYEQWIKFFLDGIYISAKNAIETIDELIKLRNINLTKINDQNFNKRTKETAIKIFNYLEAHPVIDITKTAADLSITYNTASSAINKLKDLAIIKLNKNQERNKVYSYYEYIEILKEGTEIIPTE